MALPKILASRLQRVVADVEFGKDFTTFTELCGAVAESSWAKSFGFDATLVGELMHHHGTITKVDKGTAPAPVEPVVPPKVEAPAPAVPVIPPKVEAEPPKPVTPPKVEPPAATPVVPVLPATVGEPGIKTYDEAGRGRKQCPACKKYLGNRNSVCACGHTFEAKPQAKREEVDEPAEKTQPRAVNRSGARLAISTPAGQCPHKLEGTDTDSVYAWAEKVRGTFMDRDGSWLTFSALKYFVRHFYDMFSPEYKAAVKSLEELYLNEGAAYSD